MVTFIYTLNCPLTGEIRYVGKSNNPFKRFKEHLYHSKEASHKNRWILKLEAQGLVPIITVEKIRVAQLGELNHNFGRMASAHTREKMRVSQQNRRARECSK